MMLCLFCLLLGIILILFRSIFLQKDNSTFRMCGQKYWRYEHEKCAQKTVLNEWRTFYVCLQTIPIIIFMFIARVRIKKLLLLLLQEYLFSRLPRLFAWIDELIRSVLSGHKYAINTKKKCMCDYGSIAASACFIEFCVFFSLVFFSGVWFSWKKVVADNHVDAASLRCLMWLIFWLRKLYKAG